MKHTTLLRVVTLILALLLALPLVACGNDTPDQPNTPDQPSDPSNPSTPTDPEQPTEPVQTAESVLNAIPKKAFEDGFEFLVAASASYENTIFVEQFTNDDDIDGNTVHDALFARDKMIEEYFGIDIYYDDMLDSAMYGKIGNTIRSGDDIYSLVLGTTGMALNMLYNDLLWDLNTVETIDLSQKWWNKNSVDAMMLNDKIFMATGAITNRVVFAPYGMLVNFRLREAAGLPDPYEMVLDNTWTFENFEAMIIGTSSQLNGDDKWDVNDFYGLAPAQDSETAWFFAAGGRMVEKSPEGELWAVYEEKDNYDLFSMVTDMYEGDDVLHYVALYDSNTAFKEGRAIFHSTALGDISKLADMDDQYGFLPMPKLDEAQEEYYSNTNRYINTFALLPASVQDPETMGAVIEALAAVSQFTSLDKQYDTVLLNRKAVDAQSKENLKTIVESSCYDLGYVLDPESIMSSIRSAIFQNTELGSIFASLRDPVKAKLEEYAEKFQD